MAEVSEQTIVPTLHHLTSSQSHRCLFMLEELAEAYGTQYKLVIYPRVRPPKPTGLKDHFPLGKSPILTIEEDGKPSTKVYQLPQHPGVLTESRLILNFLSDTFGRGKWDPATAEDTAQNTFWQEFAGGTLAAKVTFALIFEIIPAQLPWGLKHLVGAMVTPVVNYWKSDLQPVFQLMEDSLSEEKPWFAGSKTGVADFTMMFGMDMASQRQYFDGQKYPKLQAWHQRMTGRAAYKRANEKGGVYDLKTFV